MISLAFVTSSDSKLDRCHAKHRRRLRWNQERRERGLCLGTSEAASMHSIAAFIEAYSGLASPRLERQKIFEQSQTSTVAQMNRTEA
jgi:hypothetical protein